MTTIPKCFLSLFASLRSGDELILHKGTEEAWKVEIVHVSGRKDPTPIPVKVWKSALGPLPNDWRGRVHFQDEAGQWQARVHTFFSPDAMKGSGAIVIETVVSE